MKKILLITILLILFSTIISAQDAEITPEATEDPISTVSIEPIYSVEGDSVILDVYFNTLKQGRAGLLGLQGDNITSASASIFNDTIEFFEIEGREGWWAFISASIGQTIRQYDLPVTIMLEGTSEPQVLLTRFNIISGGFISQAVNLIPDDELARLLDPAVETTEFERIFTVASEISDEVYWNTNSFIAPLTTELTSPFGASRIFNEELETTHTGWDFNAPTGLPLLSTASGKVAFAGTMDIRGNYVLVNHGQGVYSGYAHMSVIYVTQGQDVSEGQVLGLVGTTGRSSSAHAHFEMIVNGQWVDAVDFLRMYVP
ncbi:MAG: hypothetical protein Phog2KO_03350 [Phototrophicaceae bacterium]